MNITEKLAEFESTWEDLYRKTKDGFISFTCLTSYHSARVLSDLSRMLSPTTAESGKKLLVFSTPERHEPVETMEAEILVALEESNNDNANLVDIADRMSQIYKTLYEGLFADEFYRALGFLELISHLAKRGGEPRLKRIDREFVSELNYSVYRLETRYLNDLVTFRQKGRSVFDRKSANALRKLIIETW